MTRLTLLPAIWLALTAATSPIDLMPPDGRSQAFGAHAIVRLTPARDGHPVRFGRRPPLDRDGSLHWRLDWTGSAYQVRAPDAPRSLPADGAIALRQLDGPLYIGAMHDPGTDSGVPNVEYLLLWRLSGHEFIGYLRLFGSECETLPRETLLAIGFAAADIERCAVTSWPQVEALMRAFAASQPSPLGTIKLEHHRPRG